MPRVPLQGTGDKYRGNPTQVKTRQTLNRYYSDECYPGELPGA